MVTAPRFEYARNVRIPDGATVRRADIVALAELISTTTDTGAADVEVEEIWWSVEFSTHEQEGQGLENLRAALAILQEPPDSVSLRGGWRHFATEPAGDRFGTIRVSLSISPEVSVRGTDHNWVVGTEDHFTREIRRRLSGSAPRAWRPPPWLVGGVGAFTAGIVAGFILSVVPVPPLITTPMVAAVIAATYVGLRDRAQGDPFSALLGSGVSFVLNSEEASSKTPWYQLHAVETARAISQLVGGIWVLILLTFLVLRLIGINVTNPNP